MEICVFSPVGFKWNQDHCFQVTKKRREDTSKGFCALAGSRAWRRRRRWQSTWPGVTGVSRDAPGLIHWGCLIVGFLSCIGGVRTFRVWAKQFTLGVWPNHSGRELRIQPWAVLEGSLVQFLGEL